MDYSWALNQTATYWQRGDPDGYGDYDWEDPVEIACRWVDTNERITTPAGEEVISRAKVLVNQDMQVGDVLWLGDVSTLSSSGDPANTAQAYPIRKFDRVPDILAEEYLYRAWL